MKKEYKGWTIIKKNKNGTEFPVAVDNEYEHESGLGLCGYIYVYPRQKDAKEDCEKLNVDWQDNKMNVKGFNVKKCKLVIEE